MNVRTLPPLAIAALAAAFLLAPSASLAEWEDTSFARGAVRILEDLGDSRSGSSGDGLGVSLDIDAYRFPGFGLRVSLGYFQLETLEADRPFGEPRRSDLNALYLSMGPILRARTSVVSPYLTGGAGLYLTDYDAFVEIEVGGGAFARTALCCGSLNLGLHGGAGLDVYVGGGFGLGAEVSYTNVLSQGENLQLLGVHLALDYEFD